MHRFQSLPEIFAAIRRRLPLIMALTLIGCVASVISALNTDRSYQATAVLQMEDAIVPDSLVGATAEVGRSARRVQLIEQRLMARDNLVRIMDEYDLHNDDPNMPITERLSLMRDSVTIREIRNDVTSFGADTPSGLYITVELGDAEKTAAIANELMYSVIQESRLLNVNRARDTLEFFIAEQARVSAEIEALEVELSRFKQDNAARLPAGLTDLRGQLSTLRANDLDIERQIVSLQTTSERQREEVQQRTIALLREQRALVSARIAQIETQIASAPDVERELNRLERQLAQLQDEFTLISRRKHEAELGQVLEDRQQSERFEVLETALVPELPSSRSRRSTAMIGGLLSLIGAFGVAAMLELMNPAIRTVGHMERALGVSPVVAIPNVGKGKRRRWWSFGMPSQVTATAAVPLAIFAGWIGYLVT